MDQTRLDRSDAAYPTALNHYFGKDAPLSVAVLGNLEILTHNKLALFCSVKCPAKLILQTHDLAHALVQAGVTVIGGFHSPVEKESLRILLRGSQPVIICPARGLTRLRIPKEWKKPLDEGRLLFLSPFPDNRHRSDIQMSLYRNRFVAALADWILIPYAGPSSKTEQFCREILAWQKPVYTFSYTSNENLITLGARPLTPGEDVEITLRSLERS
ncbi:MAG: DNA-processing protein DprA [Deltaproteobacteria bacterium]|nr:DNA-processing protein DprA [Deltaproteobacteria bacterium]